MGRETITKSLRIPTGLYKRLDEECEKQGKNYTVWHLELSEMFLDEKYKETLKDYQDKIDAVKRDLQSFEEVMLQRKNDINSEIRALSEHKVKLAEICNKFKDELGDHVADAIEKTLFRDFKDAVIEEGTGELAKKILRNDEDYTYPSEEDYTQYE